MTTNRPQRNRPQRGKRAAVLGAPIGHSLSPALHRAAYAELGLDWSYDAIECDEGRLPGFLDSLDDSWAGLSLTMPLKRTVLPLLDEVSALAADVGGANTVVFAAGTRRGDNTDVGGMLDALREHGVQRVRTPVVLGAGATACSALAVVQRLGAEHVTVVVRDPSRAVSVCEVAGRIGVPVHVRTFAQLPSLLPADLLLSTLPSGAADGVAHHLAGPGGDRTSVGMGTGARHGHDEGSAVLDVCYEPWPTALAAAAHTLGYTVVGGFELLLHQAARQVTLMTGCGEPPVAAMRRAGQRALAARSSARPA